MQAGENVYVKKNLREIEVASVRFACRTSQQTVSTNRSTTQSKRTR